MKELHLIGLLLCLGSITVSGQNNSEWETWIKSNSYGLALSDTSNYEDLSILKKILKDRNIVFLGENSHGVSEFTLLKSRMIRYLHDSLGFDVLAFESNAGDAYYANSKIKTSDIQTSIYNSLSSLWHTEEIVPLFNYVKRTHLTKSPLIISGVDFITSNGSYSFSRFLYELIFPLNPVYAKEIRETDSLVTHAGVRGWTIFRVLSKEEKNAYYNQVDKWLLFYSNLNDFLNKNESKFQGDRKQDLTAAKYFIHDRIDCIYWAIKDSVYMADKFPCIDQMENIADLWDRYRDYKMAQHLKFLFSTLYAGKKIIVWAEDGHIAKRKCRMAADSSVINHSYTIAFLSYSGKGCYVLEKGSENSKPERPVYDFKTPTDTLSVEKIMHSSCHEITFVDMVYQKKCEGNSWMFDTAKMTGWEGDYTSETNNIRNKWDGFILVNKISPPHYLMFDYEYLRK
jgi:erythromycin esterase